METKTFEVRDSMTFIPALAIKLEADNPDDNYLLKRAGFDPTGQYVMLVHFERGQAHYNPFNWGSQTRTMGVAHQYIEKEFDELQPGAVVDVQYILGETDAPKESERITAQY